MAGSEEAFICRTEIFAGRPQAGTDAAKFYKIEFELSSRHAEYSETATHVIHREIRPGNIDGSGNLE